MADVKISGLPASTTPLAGTEVLPIVQSGVTKQVSVANLTAGRDVSANIFISAAGAVGTPAITTTGDTNTGIWFPAADTVAVSTAGAERMRITSAGNVGIGTTAPIGPLEVVSASGSIVVRGTDLTSRSLLLAAASDYSTSFRTTFISQHNASATGTTLGLSNANLGSLGFQNGSNAVIYSNGTNVLRLGTNATTAINIASNQVISLGAAPGSESLRVTPVASAVNYLEVQGAAAGGSVSFSSVGSNADISINYWSKGNSGQLFGTGSAFTSQFAVTHTASAVNNIYVTGGVSGATPRLFSSTANIPVAITGSHTWAGFANASAAIGIVADVTSAIGGHVVIGSFNGNSPYIGASNYSTSSNNGLSLRTNGFTQFQIAPKDSAVNYIQVQGDTAAIPFFSSQGSSANIDMGFVSKGTGFHTFYTSGTSYLTQFRVANTASAVNYLQVTGGATGNATTLSAAGSDTNIDLALTPKGTGVLSFGTYTAGILAQSGYITIKDAAGNTRNLLVG